MYALVLIEYSIKSLDKEFIYKIPDNLKSSIKVGMKVIVPFGYQKLNGFVLNITNECDSNIDIKEIISIVDEELVLSQELIELASYMQDSTLCTKISSFQTMLPQGLKVKTKKHNYNKFITYLELNKDKNIIEETLVTKRLGIKQKQILNDLLKSNRVLKKNYPVTSVKSLIDLELIKEIQIQDYRINIDNDQKETFKLTKDQKDVFNSIELDKYNTYLLHGITGSGKTIVYIKLIEKVIKEGKSAILLLPEISLTTQIVKRLYKTFANDVAILHSALSIGEKHDEYLKIMRKEVHVVVGTRSAIFAPLKDLGIIIIDEEHSSTYKQDNNPRYNAKDMANFRCKYNNVPLILGSATPLLETKARADKNVFKLLTLNKRIGDAKLPKVHIVDMSLEMKKRNTIFSELLINKINEKLSKNEQVIILLNRRGYSTFVNCSSCGYIYKCPNCDISLTYHKTNNNLICHYCGYLTKKDDYCPECKQKSLNFYGLGTEKIEEYINNNIKLAKVIRMDQDTTSKKGSHEKIIKEFQEGKYNVLLGTQMISKGLDFPRVSLVGVINADTSLNIPDFRSNENTYSLLSQVSGRAGRSNILGEVVIQTFNPDNFVIECVKNNDYDTFYKKEMLIRKRLKYPPYYYLIGVKIVGSDYKKTLTEANKVSKYLKQNVEKDTIVLGPTIAGILKFNNEYRFQIIIKYRFDKIVFNTLKDLDKMYIYNKSIRIETDINPSKI